MAVSFDDEGLPHCSRCGQYLGQQSGTGRCPKCSHWFSMSYARAASGRPRLISLLAAGPRKIVDQSDRWQFSAIVFLLALNAVIIMSITLMAWRALMRDMGMPGW
ncbi:MAG: hypothetical protein GC200_10045 [Tepidisphaera sp.]|nr:hypothetical protein [Tepidisphaera sp.]